MKKDQAALRGNASELESKADLTEEYVKELQDCKNWCAKGHSKIPQRDNVILNLRRQL